MQRYATSQLVPVVPRRFHTIAWSSYASSSLKMYSKIGARIVNLASGLVVSTHLLNTHLEALSTWITYISICLHTHAFTSLSRRTCILSTSNLVRDMFIYMYMSYHRSDMHVHVAAGNVVTCDCLHLSGNGCCYVPPWWGDSLWDCREPAWPLTSPGKVGRLQEPTQSD